MVQHMKLAIVGAVFAAGLAFGTTGAQAAACGTGLVFDTASVSLTSLDGSAVSIDASDCAGAFDGNDTGAMGTLLTNLNGTGMGDEIFAGYAGNWSILGKSDEAMSGVEADNDELSGDWSAIFSGSEYSVFAISLKAARNYVVYLFDVSSVTGAPFEELMGEFSMLGLLNPGGKTPELSHLTVAVFDGGDVPAPVPVPAAGLLLAGALAGLAALRRRKAA